MEWVETTAKSLDEAKEAALDELGVAEDDAEFEVLEEPRPGLFGRMRGEARVRARVRPTRPRPKVERRDRRERRPRNTGRGARARGPHRGDDAPAAASTAEAADDREAETAAEAGSEAPTGAVDKGAPPARTGSDPGPSADRPAGGGQRRRRGGRGRTRSGTDDGAAVNPSEVDVEAQTEVVQTFLEDLLDAFDFDAEVTSAVAEDDAVEFAVHGDDLGLLIGPKGQTIQAVQELCRSVLQRQRPGESHMRLRVDIGGYRQRRREALERFVRQVAGEVVSSGVAKELEPMAPPDRKVVHDTVNTIDGVRTTSEGEEPRRRVIILPE